MKRVGFVTFGCKVSQYESQALREALAARGYEVVPPEARPDLYVINTCTVTETAYKEAERIVRRLRRKDPAAEFAITGCAADSHAEQFLGLPGVRRVFTHDEKSALPLALDDPRLTIDDLQPSIFDLKISRFDGHTRAFLKVQDGCDLNCSFCIIPKVRGGNVSRPMEECVDEARRLVDNGAREIVVTGVHTGSFDHGLDALVEKMLSLPGLARVRLSSIEVTEIGDRLLNLMAANLDRFCPHFHLPLQSGDDAVLRAMRRRYNTAQYRRAIDRIRAKIAEPGLTTDVIVGFPTESEEAFERTAALCREIGFSRIHLFPYSRRTGTDAAALPDLPQPVKKARLHRLEDLARELAEGFARRFVGRDVDVLVEEDGRGYTERYLPARLPGAAANTLARVRPRTVEKGVLQCAL
ncbi:MAG: tRNA (N(6)-L-threonylcarbamoyladenosine(37)-C(2))-methylthiotransferase MtaB [Planctomycetes bacterium]|nr:tRNA (N(6)-L-threonylcarbamoyladenosine(37)-C(2))-methylthiotransferase MtaB [Planctomycetota bacterium]